MSFDPERVVRLIDEVELVDAGGHGPVGWVYFIAAIDTTRCKIGFTKGDPQKRLASLQTGSANELVIVAQQPGTPETERRLHEKFSAHRIHGEWFTVTDELRAYMVAVLWAMSEIALRAGRHLEPWMSAGLLLTGRKLGCISESLNELLELGRE